MTAAFRYEWLDTGYPANNLACGGEVWRHALETLLAEALLVLIDLGSFSADHAGLAYEIDQVIARIPASRILLWTNQYTDQEYLARTLERAWEQAPYTVPVRVYHSEAPKPGWHNVEEERKRDEAIRRELIGLLCDSAIGEGILRQAASG